MTAAFDGNRRKDYFRINPTPIKIVVEDFIQPKPPDELVIISEQSTREFKSVDPVLDMPKSIANSLARHRIAEIVFSDQFEESPMRRTISKEFTDE